MNCRRASTGPDAGASGGKEATLDDACRVHERLARGEGDLDRPSSGLTATSSQPSVAADAGIGALPSTASQNGPVRVTVSS